MLFKKSIINANYIGSKNRKSLIDLSIPKINNGKLIIFIHGYMGYKDWGCWNLVERYFNKLGYSFCKFNMSHNGGTEDNGIDFPDTKAFENNCYSYEVNDLKYVLNWINQKEETTFKSIHLMGHSRGGAIALLNANNDMVDSIITCAAISDIESRFPKGKKLNEWKENKIRFIKNGRTKQELGHSYTQYEDFILNKEKLNIKNACDKTKKPTLIFHGKEDESVNINEGKKIAEWLNTSLNIIKNTKHTFGASQPWNHDYLPEPLEELCHKTHLFLQKKFP